VLRQDVLSALMGRPGTLDQIALDVRGRRADVLAALRELEDLGLATRRSRPHQGWAATQEGTEAKPGTSGNGEHALPTHPCFPAPLNVRERLRLRPA
jgi:hypothetical protein